MAVLCQLCGFYISVKSYHIFRRAQHLSYGSKLLKVKYLYYIYQVCIYNETFICFSLIVFSLTGKKKIHTVVCVDKVNSLNT